MEIAAVAIGLAFLITGFLVWRLMSGPVDVGFAKSYIEEALHDPVSGYSVSVDNAVVEWPEIAGPLLLEFSNVQLIKEGNSVLKIQDVSLGLMSRYLFLGIIKPISIKLEKPELNIIRTENNEIKLSLDDNVPDTNIAPGDEPPLMQILDTMTQPKDEINKNSPLDKLQTLEITDAKMVIADYLAGMTWLLSPMNLTFIKDPKGLVVSANVKLPGGRDTASRIQGDLVYFRERNNFVANVHIQDFDPHILSRKIESLDFLNDHYAILNGNIEVGFDTNFHINKAAVSLSSQNGALALKGVYDEPLPFEELFINALYDEKQGLADLRELSVKAKGLTLNISSPFKITENSADGTVKINIPDLPQEKIAPIWPDVLKGEGAEEWLINRLATGRMHDINTSFDVSAVKEDETWKVGVNNILSDFLIENMDIDYRAPLEKITSANGKGHFSKDALTIEISDGNLGDIKVTKGKVVIDKIIEGGGNADINIDLDGPLQSVFRYIQPEPIGISEEKLGLTVADVKGKATLNVNVNFPTVRDLLAEQVIVKAQGTLNDVLLPDIVKTLDLTGGPFNISVADGAAKLDGSGKLDGRDIKFAWQEFVDPEGKEFSSQVSAELLADKSLRDILGIGLEDWIEGTFPINVTYTEYQDDTAKAYVKADLAPGSVMVGPLDYKKQPGEKGNASCIVSFNGGFVSEVQNLNVETNELRVNNARFIFNIENGETVLRRGNIPEFFLSENELNMDLEITTSGLLKMSVKGDFLDARPFLGDKKSKEAYDGPPLMISATVNRMRTHPARLVEKVKVYLDMSAQGDIDQFEMDAVAGKGDVYLRFKPNEKGLMALQLEADDAGAMLRAFDIYENVKGGKIVVYGEAKSKQERKKIYGNAQLSDFSVVNAPVLAQLLNAISLFGIQQLLGGEGIYFSQLESEFEWHLARKGDSYYFKEGRTSGSSLGLTFEGRILKSQDLINVEGTIVPVSLVSEIIGGIPLIGDILTGGGGGLIAATYKIEGPIKKPEVSVNPLSALAPGILRTILFEN